MSAREPYIRLYKDAEGKWRWSYHGANGRILADSGQGYWRRRDCESAAQDVTSRELMWFGDKLGAAKRSGFSIYSIRVRFEPERDRLGYLHEDGAS